MMSDSVDLYDSAYGSFAATVLEQVRREAFGKDIGQNSWLTADEYLRFFKWLELKSTSNVLEIACGSGGPALFMARTIGCHIRGIDKNENGIATANKMAQERSRSEINYIAGARITLIRVFSAPKGETIMNGRIMKTLRWWQALAASGKYLALALLCSLLLVSSSLAHRS